MGVSLEEIQSRIIEINIHLTNKIYINRINGVKYQPNTGDEDQPLREELKVLYKILKNK